MKPYHSVLLFVAFVGCAIVTSINNYGCAKDYIIADMNQALEKTLAEKSDAWITPDTIADYRSHLKNVGLRETSVIYYAMDEDGGSLKSRKMAWRNGKGWKLEFQGFANCSMASVFAMSDFNYWLFRSKATLTYQVFEPLSITYSIQVSQRMSQIAMISDTRIRTNSLEWT